MIIGRFIPGGEQKSGMLGDHGHSLDEVRARIGDASGNGNLRDAVYGGIDGAVTTFAIVAGVAGAGLPSFVIVTLGIANVLADGFSMAAGNYSGTKSDLDNLKRLRRIEAKHIDLYPEGELLELREILRRKGLTGAVLEQATAEISRNRQAWIDLMLVDEYGVSPVDPAPLRAATVTFFAFLLTGLVPLLPFILGWSSAFSISIGATLATFFAIGAAKSVWSPTAWWRSGLETLFIGGVAAWIAYAVGSLFDSGA
ncbi:MAG: VIT1/CCC1 transporter family protein [Paracoccaceae bacterium]|nr:VIT1/CCC1 transporter family protein [Paracoccaceae bacterium]